MIMVVFISWHYEIILVRELSIYRDICLNLEASGFKTDSAMNNNDCNQQDGLFSSAYCHTNLRNLMATI